MTSPHGAVRCAWAAAPYGESLGETILPVIHGLIHLHQDKLREGTYEALLIIPSWSFEYLLANSASDSSLSSSSGSMVLPTPMPREYSGAFDHRLLPFPLRVDSLALGSTTAIGLSIVDNMERRLIMVASVFQCAEACLRRRCRPREAVKTDKREMTAATAVLFISHD